MIRWIADRFFLNRMFDVFCRRKNFPSTPPFLVLAVRECRQNFSASDARAMAKIAEGLARRLGGDRIYAFAVKY